MKRLFVLVLVLIMIPSAVLCEMAMDNQPTEYVGLWASFIPKSATLYGDMAFALSVNSDGTFSLFISLNSSKEKSVTASAYTGKWTAVSDTIVFLRDGKDTYGQWDCHDDMIWIELSGGKFGLKKIPVIDITQVIIPDMSDDEND